jgi:hypothetical protein
MRGHIRERGEGNWYAVLSPRDPDGRRKLKWHKLNAARRRERNKEGVSVNP